MSVVELLVIIVTTVPALQALTLWLQVVAAREPAAEPTATSPHPRVAVLVPAHNEAGGIEPTLRTALSQLDLANGDRLLVVADNCTDDTAAVASRAGAQVIARHDAARRGKGYALDFGVRHLSGDAPQVLVILDADCIVHEQAIDRLVRACVSTGRPTQARYLMQAPPRAGLATRMAAFAWRVKNEVRPLGALRMGGPCQLMGTGMAFPWPVIRDASLATAHLVEDMQLGVELASMGRLPLFVPQALVTSEFPLVAQAARAQRTRWEHGHLAVLLSSGPRLLLQALSRRNWGLFLFAVDLLVPPLALLVMLCAGLALFNLLVGYAWLGWIAPALLSAATLALLAWAVLDAWRRFGRGVVSLRELALAPLYALRKLPLYLGFLRHRQAEWVRTKRDSE